MARLTAKFWIDAYRQRLESAGIPVFVSARGDATAGAVMIKCATLDGKAQALQRSFDPMSGERIWMVLAEGDERDVDALIAKQRARDPDLWVLEIEDPAGRTLLDEAGLE